MGAAETVLNGFGGSLGLSGATRNLPGEARKAGAWKEIFLPRSCWEWVHGYDFRVLCCLLPANACRMIHAYYRWHGGGNQGEFFLKHRALRQGDSSAATGVIHIVPNNASNTH